MNRAMVAKRVFEALEHRIFISATLLLNNRYVGNSRGWLKFQEGSNWVVSNGSLALFGAASQLNNFEGLDSVGKTTYDYISSETTTNNTDKQVSFLWGLEDYSDLSNLEKVYSESALSP